MKTKTAPTAIQAAYDEINVIENASITIIRKCAANMHITNKQLDSLNKLTSGTSDLSEVADGLTVEERIESMERDRNRIYSARQRYASQLMQAFRILKLEVGEAAAVLRLADLSK